MTLISKISSHSDLQIGLFKSIDGDESEIWAKEIMKNINLGFNPISREEAIMRADSGYLERKIISKLIKIYQ